ncbi:MAG TPA: FliI/YscN family ATPase [Phycisphaerae bacterium]|nr:FliI/YscN family ATPase [Phycisphaerae bacterium]HNU46156.1 FliI/YscN family ATPase [Phycisphaerae bacterium]
MADLFAEPRRLVQRTATVQVTGRVVQVTGLTVVAEGLPLPVGSFCTITRAHAESIPAQVVAFQAGRTVLMTLQEPQGVGAGDCVRSAAALQFVPVGRQMLGRVVDGLGRPIDGHGAFNVEAHLPVYREAPQALARRPIDRPLSTGIRAIDALHTVGGGQRLGIFAGTGVGKSVLLGMIARYTAADVTVVALIGERGREVGDFLRKDLGPEGLKRCVLVVSTAHESPVLRVRAGFVATAVAEYFRDQGQDVLLLMDSTTRLAMAQRQIGLSAGEPPTTKGYPPSVFALLPQLLERSGRTERGSITGLYTVLVEGDDITEPISDAIRGILDGHVWLARGLANRGHYPAVAVLESISRVMVDVAETEHLRAARTVRRVLAVWADIEDLVNIGAYAVGTNVEFDVAVQMKPRIDEFLQQAIAERAEWSATVLRLVELAGAIETLRAQLQGRRAAAPAA